MNKKTLHIVHLYPDEMNTYGDRGNILTLKRRAEWHGLEPVIHNHHPGKPFPVHVDLVFGGGGQDSAQTNIQEDLANIGPTLKKLAEKGVPMLVICGTYQQFGHRFITHNGEIISGIGIFDLETRATKHRLIGNLAAKTDAFGTLYGFENHSGQTYLSPNQTPLGTTIRGNGNNEDGKTEGARIHNVIGTYMHGPILPLNPRLTDWLLMTASKLAQIDAFNPHKIQDNFVDIARKAAATRKY